MPSKADPNTQKAFIKDRLNPLIKQAEDGVIELFFMDASHFVMGGFAGRVWSKVRKFVKTASGRKRFNVLGALNFATKKIEIISNSTYITSTQVVELLELLSRKYCGKIVKVVLDNASYQRCALVKDKALSLGIELVFLPTYSPNLNLIERVWKLVKSKVLNSAYYETFESYCKKIELFVTFIHIKQALDMQTLITPNFHVVDTDQIIG